MNFWFFKLTLYQMTEFWTCSKLETFAESDDKCDSEIEFTMGRVENIVGKGENAGYQHFLLFPQCFQNPTFSR